MNTTFLEQLNLTPQERRIVVIIAVVVFVVLNMLLVWPHFKDLARVRQQLAETRDTMKKFNELILKDIDPSTNGFRNQLAKLQSQQGGAVVNQQVQLQKSISDQAIKTGVNISDTRPAVTAHPLTNAFYDEQAVRVTFECQEPQLVTFLYNIGNDPAMIRVREINLHVADANRYRLKGDALLSANYAKPTPVAAPKAAVPSGKPAAAPAPAKQPAPPPGGRMLPGLKPPTLNRAPGAQPGH